MSQYVTHENLERINQQLHSLKNNLVDELDLK